MPKFKLVVFLSISVTFLVAPAFSQDNATIAGDFNKRDPFLPLVDENGAFRADFDKPLDNTIFPQVALQGISKVNGVFYAIIDGEWRKDGDTVKGLLIEKIWPDSVNFIFMDRKITIKLDAKK